MLSDADKVRYVQACEAWKYLGESATAVLAQRMNEERYDAGTVIVGEAEDADRVFVVAEGAVAVHLAGAA
jgi:CRP-like cAMP-binding protein